MRNLFLLAVQLLSLTTGLSQISGKIDHFEKGTAYLMGIWSRDTLDVSSIENFKFHFDPDVDPSNQAIPAMIMCVRHDNKHSVSAPIAIEGIAQTIHFHKEVYQSYSGSPLQDRFSTFIKKIMEMEMTVSENNPSQVNDSIKNSMDKMLDSFYISNRNTKLRTFASFFVTDIINRKLTDPTNLAQIRQLCNEPHKLDADDKRICEGIATFNMSWEGKQALPITAIRSDETMFDLSTIIGSKMIILDFWASWCGPCIKEMPELKELYKEGKVEIVGISIDNQKGPWLKVLEKLDLPWISVWDEGKKISQSYNVTSVPTKFVIDKNGLIVARNPTDIRGVIEDKK